MKRDIIISVFLHSLIIASVLMATPFGDGDKINPKDIIMVDLVFGQDPFPEEASAPPEIIETDPPPSRTMPQPAEDEPIEIPISDPTTSDEITIDDEPEIVKPDPEPERTAPSGQTVEEEQTSEIHSPVTAGASPFAGARVDNASFQYPYWFTQAFNKILRQWRNPVASNASLVCVIYFQVIKSGRIIESRIETSSGIDQFDEACLRAVTSSAPFPPLPRQFADEIIGLSLPFKYDPSR
jgi:TonB family protein